MTLSFIVMKMLEKHHMKNVAIAYGESIVVDLNSDGMEESTILIPDERVSIPRLCCIAHEIGHLYSTFCTTDIKVWDENYKSLHQENLAWLYAAMLFPNLARKDDFEWVKILALCTHDPTFPTNDRLYASDCLSRLLGDYENAGYSNRLG